MARGPGRSSILIVDDDELSRDLLTVLLEAEGYTVHTAESGDAALRALGASIPPDVILTDMQMPGISGAALAERVRAICPGDDTRLLAMSGSLPECATLAAFDGFLLKPFSVEEVAGAINAVAPGQPPASLDLSAAPPEPTEDVGTALDAKTFRELSEIMRPAQISELYDMGLRDAATHVSAMTAAAQAGDDAAFRRRAHAMKGSFGMLGARDLQAMAAEMELAGPGSADYVATLQRFTLAMETLRRILMARGLPLTRDAH